MQKALWTRISLKTGFMLVTALLFIVSAVGVTWSVRMLSESIVEQWAPRYIAKQALYDKARTLQPILREVALSRQLAGSRFIRDWAKDPASDVLTRRSLDELENYRLNFQDKSYFVAMLKNGHYYHNNAANEYSGKELRYILDPEKKADAWFYDIIRQERNIHINVNPDEELGITKLWIDVLIRDGSQILGMAGTGLDLTQFLETIVQENDPGIISLFVDHTGSIQLHRNQRFIDFGSVSKKDGTHKTLDLIFQNETDRKSIDAAMQKLEAGKESVATAFVTVEGKRQLAGLVYLPEIDWYEITLIDLGTVLPFSQFFMIIIVYILSLFAALIIYNFILNRFILNPLGQLDRAMGQVESGKDPGTKLRQGGLGEVDRLFSRFLEMAMVVLARRRDLEQQVQDRTADLERLAKIDPLTELLNRRGMTEALEAGMARADRELVRIGILWIDLDYFKQINDTHGHQAGDRALCTVAGIIKSIIRPYDLAARWGGDEFLVMLQPADEQVLSILAERLRAAVEKGQDPWIDSGLSISVGGSLSAPGLELSRLLHNADQALYHAKEAGRNCFRTLPDGDLK